MQTTVNKNANANDADFRPLRGRNKFQISSKRFTSQRWHLSIYK